MQQLIHTLVRLSMIIDVQESTITMLIPTAHVVMN